ncbi:MAG TPA: hypothetical protein PLQ88_10790 [Blastocatellia bacterium]|nr:hypothetical protein [Blastocatellia bacterium]HMV86329.1 hypothetical protein [Blastocatellia bacterium]HMY72310.1 hypothetical protein [Blastocatellia bacterium]HNG31289.1 hypothetical protein [Blastocatellia bacterium]
MKSATQKTLKFALALFVFAAFVGALSLFTTKSGGAGWLSAPAVEAAPVANSARIIFKNSKGQEIREGRPFPLDRVERGERYALIVEARNYPVRIEVRAANGYYKAYTASSWFCVYDTVSRNPSFDNVWVTVFDSATGHQLDRQRLPIGTK